MMATRGVWSLSSSTGFAATMRNTQRPVLAESGHVAELRLEVREALVRALEQIHALLNADQRQRLAYLIRTGVLTI